MRVRAHDRVRFARLSWIRKILGGRPDEVEQPYDAESFVEDDEYLILDIVLNWVRRSGKHRVLSSDGRSRTVCSSHSSMQ